MDYDAIAPRYDAVRSGGGPFWPALAALAAEIRPRDALELGCGTGNNTALFLQGHPCRLAAVDLSGGMLRRALAKGAAARFIQASAFNLPFADRAFDFAFGVYVLHYLHPLTVALAECWRALRPGGAAFFVTAPLAFVDEHPMNRYFPSFAAIERKRFLPQKDIKAAMTAAGFTGIRLEVASAPPAPIDAHYLERVRGKHISTFDLMGEGEYRRGLRSLEAAIQARGRLGVDLVWKTLIVEGRRPAR